MSEPKMEDLLARRGLKQKKGFPILETVTANQKAKPMTYDDVKKAYPLEMAQAEAIFFESIAERLASGSLFKNQGVVSKKPSLAGGLEKPANGIVEPDSRPIHDANDDIANWWSGSRKDKQGRKFLVPNTKRTPSGGIDEASVTTTDY